MSALAVAEAMLRSGNPAAALRLLRESAEPGEARDMLLARCALRLNDIPGCIAAFSAVLARNPAHVEAAASLGALYVNQGWLDKALAHYTACLARRDDDRLHVDLAIVHYRRGDVPRALARLDLVLERSPGHPPALLQRGICLMAAARHAEAARDLRRLVQLQPAHDDAWGLLGTALFGADEYEASVEAWQEACRRRPADGGWQKSRALALTMAGRLDEAREALAALRLQHPQRWREIHDSTLKSRIPGQHDEVDPRPLFLVSAYQEQKACNWRYRGRLGEVFREFVADPRSVDPTTLMHVSGIVELDVGERRRLAGHAAAAVTTGIVPWSWSPAPLPGRLRVGYVLPQLGDHVVARILHPLLAAHDPAAIEVHVVVTRQLEAEDGSVRASYAAVPGLRCHDLREQDDAAAAATLKSLEFDVLVDLGVYNDGARPGILARRPAPVQVSFLGAPFSSGALWMDYIITDPVVAPEQAGWCSEAEVRLPGCYFVYGHEAPLPPEAPAREVLGLPAGRFLYSALNNPYKIAPPDLDSWARILAATPDSLLLLKGDAGVADNLRREAASRGIPEERLLFLPRVSQGDYLLRQGLPDLFLDTSGYGAHTTLAESLWMGVPGVSLCGNAFQNRVGASLLRSCGLPDLVAPDRAGYEAIAVSLYNERARLAQLKGRLRAARLEAAPFDVAGQARRLERAYRQMRARFAAGLPPEPFQVQDAPA